MTPTAAEPEAEPDTHLPGSMFFPEHAPEDRGREDIPVKISMYYGTMIEEEKPSSMESELMAEFY